MSDVDLTPKTKITKKEDLEWYYALPGSLFCYDYFMFGRRHFPYYDNWYSFCLPPFRNGMVKSETKLFEALDLPKGSKLFDAGCGNCMNAFTGATKFGHNIIGVDYTERHVLLSKKNVAGWEKRGLLQPGQIQPNRGDYHHLENFPAESFDGVYAHETMSHAHDIEQVIKGFFRLTKPGGRFAMVDYDNVLDENSPDPEIRRLHERMACLDKWTAMHTNKKSKPGMFKAVIEKAGYVDVKVEDISLSIRPFIFWGYIVSVIPYQFVKLFGLEKYFTNMLCAVEQWNGRNYWRILRFSATKPGELKKTQ